MVEDVEAFGAELNVVALGNVERLGGGHVVPGVPRAVELAALQGADPRDIAATVGPTTARAVAAYLERSGASSA